MPDPDTAVLRAKYGDLGGQVCPLCESWRSCGCESAAEDVLTLCDALDAAQARAEHFRQSAAEWDANEQEQNRRAEAAEARARKAEGEHLDERDRHLQTMKRATAAEAVAIHEARTSKAAREQIKLHVADLRRAEAQLAAVRTLCDKDAGDLTVDVADVLAALDSAGTPAEGGHDWRRCVFVAGHEGPCVPQPEGD